MKGEVMKLNQQSQALIESAIQKSYKKLARDPGQIIVTDIHLQPIQGSGELFIFDDDDNELSCTVIEEWISYNGSDFYKDSERMLRSILNRMRDNGILETLPFPQPYSFVLIDEEKETFAELLIMDDDTLLMNDEFLKGLDEELNTFLKELLKN